MPHQNLYYCSVSCGVLIYTTGDKSKNAKADIIHIEGDPDNPSIAARCARRAPACSTWSTARNRPRHPEVREPGSNEWKRSGWDDALTRIAKHMKADRDANLIEKNADGVTVNRWNTFGFLASSAANNEPVTSATRSKTLRLGAVALDTQARI